jgi:hypothetical protein
MIKKHRPSIPAHTFIGGRFRQINEQDNLIDKLYTSRTTFVILAVVVVILIIIGGVITVGIRDNAYIQGYDDGENSGFDNSTYGYGNSSYPSNNIQYDPKLTSVQYAIASANPNVLWGLADPYNDQIISPSTQATPGMPFGIPITACTVYLVTMNGSGQQATSPVPASQVPQQYTQSVSGCNPASVVPWWVSDQFAARGPVNNLNSLNSPNPPGEVKICSQPNC